MEKGILPGGKQTQGTGIRCVVNHNGPITGRFLISTMLRPYLFYHHDNPTETHTMRDSTVSIGGGEVGPSEVVMAMNFTGTLFRDRDPKIL